MQWHSLGVHNPRPAGRMGRIMGCSRMWPATGDCAAPRGLKEFTIICGPQWAVDNSADTETVVSAYICMRVSNGTYFLTRWQVTGCSPVCGWVRWGRKTQAVCITTWLGLRRTEVLQNNVLTFYGSLSSSTYGSVKDLACRLLSEFGSTYLCEQTFSIMNMNKNELRSNLTDNNLCSILRLATTKLEPNVDKVVDSIQAQPLTED